MTWVQPEDLVGHEFRQAAEDGRAQAAEPLLRVWLAAGGHLAPTHAGASPTPAAPRLRALATDLLTALDALPRPWAATEPDTWPPAPTTRPEGGAGAGPGARAGGWIGAGAGSPTPPLPETGGRPPAPQGTDTSPPGAAPGPAPAPHPRPGAAPARGSALAPQHGDTPPPETAQAAPQAPAPHPRPGAAPTARPGGSPHPVAGPGVPGSPAGAPGPVGPAARSGTGPGADAPGCVTARRDAAPAVDSALRRRLEAAWLGRAVGCVLGKPVEKLPLHGIRALARAAGNWPLDDWFTERGVPPEVLAAHPWNRRSAPTSLAENIDGAPEDDDLNYPLLGLLLLRRHGRGFTTADVGRLWLDELPAGRTFTAERVAYRNLLQGLEPPATATHHNPFREWIGALIRADVHGWTNPGAPAAAAAQAYRDAALTHTGNGVYAALFVAAATATAATGRADVHTALRAGLAVVPPRSRLAEAVRSGIAAAGREPDFDAVVDHLHARYGHYHWVHAVPNTALIAAALTHADGDFTRSVCHAVSGGWDTDSNGATAGALAGLIADSPDAVPHRWTAPLKNRLATSVPGFDGIGFDALAHLTAQEAARP
ncbi:ADP-ribosylglycohydrolase family protein [Streptomyces sp. H34-S4]|nr:ADP-ribosylglycohydrolase family protein [Streptomyces sp. H34-S4]MCY0937657.1 ADP-ribosylglycohydrolase family protein [Streptomyces sp. H34-S4]